MMIDLAASLNAPLLEVWGITVIFTPSVSDAGSGPYEIVAIFDRHHVLVLDQIKGSELSAPGHSTTAPVLTVRLSDFSIVPRQNDRFEIEAETFLIWDVQPDGRGMADVLLRVAA